MKNLIEKKKNIVKVLLVSLCPSCATQSQTSYLENQEQFYEKSEASTKKKAKAEDTTKQDRSGKNPFRVKDPTGVGGTRG
jgi:hypothetical protein